MTDIAPEGALNGCGYAGSSPLERARSEFVASLVAYDRAARASPCAKLLFPPDVDLEAELSKRFAEICE